MVLLGVADGSLTGFAKLLLILHIAGAVIGFGPTYGFPILLGIAKNAGESRRWMLTAMHKIAKGMATPMDVIQPATGVGIILLSHNLWNPFHSYNRWLFAAIILYVVLMVVVYGFLTPALRKALGLAEAGDYGPAFDTEWKKLNSFGPVAGLLTTVILVLMIWKPGANVPHF